MRWVFFAISVWFLIVAQTTFGSILRLDSSAAGPIGPDLLAPLAVFVALHARRQTDVLIAVWAMGLAIDLLTLGGPGSSSVVGPMALAYVLGAKLVFSVRDAIFRERILTKALLTGCFCLVAHCLWVTLQSVMAFGHTSWGQYGRMILQSVGIASYTAVLAPGMIWILHRGRNWLIQVRASSHRDSR